MNNNLKQILAGLVILAGVIFAGTYSMTAKADGLENTIECSTELKPAGIFYNTCPRGTVADGADSFRFANQNGYSRVRVRCVRPITTCEKVIEVAENEEVENLE